MSGQGPRGGRGSRPSGNRQFVSGRQGSDQYSTPMRDNSGGGCGGRGGYRGGGGGGRGGRGRGPPPEFLDPSQCRDPYIGSYTPAQQNVQTNGWKPYEFGRKEEVVLQKYVGPPAQWAVKTIDVSVNHFLIKSSLGEKSFPIPDLYHYDICYEMKRPRKKDDAKGVQGNGKGQGKSKRKRPASEEGYDVGAAGDHLDDLQIGKPPAKRLPKHLTKVILDYLIPKIRRESKHNGIATDGSFNMYSSKKLEEVKIPMEHVVQLTELKKKGFMEEDDEGVVTVLFEQSVNQKTGNIHTISTAAIARHFQGNATLRGYNFSPEERQGLEAACNAFVRSFPNFQYFAVGRSTMVPVIQQTTQQLGGGLIAWRGLSANIAMGWKPYLNVDIANCAFVLDKLVLEVLQEVMRDPKERHSWSYCECEEAKALLKSCKITYVVDGKKLGGPIRDLHEKSAREAKFFWDDQNKNVSVFDYYKERYGVALKHPNGPVLVIRKTALVPAELCTIKKGQSYNRRLEGNQTSEMLKFAKRDPAVLEQDILDRVKNMNLPQNEVVNGLGIQVSDQMLKLKARVLVPPTLRYGIAAQGNKVAHISPTDGTWEIWSNNFSFYKPVEVKTWGVLVVGCPRLRGDALDTFCRSLTRNGSSKGVHFATDPVIWTDSRCRRNNDPLANVDILKNTFKSVYLECELVVVVFPGKGDPLYGQIKHAAEVDVGVLTQCVAEKNVSVCKDATVQNILLKINSKLGGINHVTVAPFDRNKASKFATLIMDCPILVLGADVTHAPPGSKKVVNGREFVMPSYAAVTGSLDKTCMPYMTEVRAQRKEKAGAAEVIQDLEAIVRNMLISFRQRSGGIIPQKIIYFRDGVGEGQFPEVLHVEMKAIRNACRSLKSTYEPKITFITVQKRHKTRIFATPTPGRIENAPAGTVVDSEIVHATETDFYLLSHKGMMGTSRPSRYHVLWDDSDFSHDVLQSLAYTLCYMYVRCTKSVKMPAPTYYAHLAADRAKKLCEGFECKYGDPTDENLNKMLQREGNFVKKFPMHFV